MALIIPPNIEAKIGADDHGNVSAKEVHECFENHDGGYCFDGRPEHLDEHGKPTPWFVGDTNRLRRLKIMFVKRDGDIYLKSAYPATAEVERIFAKYAK